MAVQRRIIVKNVKVMRCESRPVGSLIRRLHYSHSAAINPQWNFGFFSDGCLIGAAQFGPPMCYAKVLPLVLGTHKTDMIELNRFVLIPEAPANCASRCMSICLRYLRRIGIKWVLSYANAMQSGTGVLYRATGFVLCGVKQNDDSKHPSFYQLPDGRVFHVMSIKRTVATKLNRELRVGDLLDATSGEVVRHCGAVPLIGKTYRYIKFLDGSWVQRLTVPILPYSCAASVVSDAPRNQRGEGGANPTAALCCQPFLF